MIAIYAIESTPIVAVKAIREAVRVLRSDQATNYGRARTVFDTFKAGGVALLPDPCGPFDEDEAALLIAALRENGVFATSGDFKAAKAAYEAERAPQPVAPAPEPEPQIRPDAAAATALALVVMAEGNPLRAAAHAVTLCRAQGDATTPVWRATQQYIFATFPWVSDMLEADPNGVVL